MCLLNKLGRRVLISGLLIASGITFFGALTLTELSKKNDVLWMLEFSKWLTFTGKFAISGAFGAGVGTWLTLVKYHI